MKLLHVSRDALALGLALGAALLAYRFVLDLGLMGWDTYPLIAASQVDSAGDWFGLLTEELMGGRYPDGSFYRPVTSSSFALDHRLWQLDPVGYLTTNLLILLAEIVVVYLLARRWLTTCWAPLLAVLIFALHPLQLETVPVPARRADMLFTGFLVAALALLPLAGRGPRAHPASAKRANWGNQLAVAVLVVLSSASKDTGVVALPVVFVATALLVDAPDLGSRIALALRRCALPIAGYAVYLACRTWVLQGLGGHPGSSLFGGALMGLFRAPDFGRMLLFPQPWLGTPILDLGLAALLAAGLAATLIPVGNQTSTEDPGFPGRSLSMFLGLWITALLVMHGIAGERASWYAVPFLPAYALLVAQAAEIVVARRLPVAATVVGGITVVALTTSHLLFSSLVHDYPTWRQISREQSEFLDSLDAAIASAETGTTIRVEGLPLGLGTPLERVGIRSALCMSDYSVESWAELMLPNRSVRARLLAPSGPTPPTPGVIQLDLVPLPSPVLQPLRDS